MVASAAQEHAELQGLLDAISAAVGERTWNEVAGMSRRLLQQLRQHFELEEQVLFPRLLDRVEHEMMASFLEQHLECLRTIMLICQMLEAMTADERHDGTSHPDVGSILDSLRHLLKQHMEMEERFLFHATDLVLADAQVPAERVGG
jgi:hemerythrin-like domain-containing protein